MIKTKTPIQWLQHALFLKMFLFQVGGSYNIALMYMFCKLSYGAGFKMMTNGVMLLEPLGGYRAVGWGRVWTKRLDRPQSFRFGFPRDSSNMTHEQSYKHAESGADLNEQCSVNSTVCDLRLTVIPGPLHIWILLILYVITLRCNLISGYFFIIILLNVIWILKQKI